MAAMGMSLALVSQKGGVGKTTLSANLAASFADLRFKTLLVEIDPQGSLIQCFGLDRFDVHHGLFGCVKGEIPSGRGIERNLSEGLDLLPANIWSHEEERAYQEALAADPDLLRRILDGVRADYDYLILDCPPALGPLTRAALTAADRYLVPVQAETLNLANLSRLEHLVGEVRAASNPELSREGYVVTMADTRTRHANTVIEYLSREFPRDLKQTIIPRSIRVADDAGRGKPTVLGSARSRAGRAFQALAEEILSRHSRDRVAGQAAEGPAAEEGSVADEDVTAWNRVLDTTEEADRWDETRTGNGRPVPVADSWDLD